MLKFNSNGLLIPNNNIVSSVRELENTFVRNIKTKKREEIFASYIKYSNSLKEICKNSDLLQWIDGSFVTQKPEPGDIDLVTFIDFRLVDQQSEILKDYKFPLSEDLFGVDAYIVKLYPEGHKYYVAYLSDKAYWMDHFNKTRRNKFGGRLQKGFLEINL